MRVAYAPGAFPAGVSSFGWRPLARLSDDENLVDLARMVARNSVCKGGHMGACLLRPPPEGAGGRGGAWTLRGVVLRP